MMRWRSTAIVVAKIDAFQPVFEMMLFAILKGQQPTGSLKCNG
jgi:hypothetical protein